MTPGHEERPACATATFLPRRDSDVPNDNIAGVIAWNTTILAASTIGLLGLILSFLVRRRSSSSSSERAERTAVAIRATSSKPREEFFVYKPGVKVPRATSRALVHGSVKRLPPRAFRGCRHLKEVVLPEGLLEIGRGAFQGCTSLGRLHLPSTLVEIGDLAFYCCTSLRKIEFREGLLVIGRYAFAGCSFERIVFPSTLTAIDKYAFSSCTALKVVSLHAEILPAIDRWAFSDSNSLRMVQLRGGGIQMIKEESSLRHNTMGSVTIPPKALVIAKIGESYDFGLATKATIPRPRCEQVVIGSECFNSLRPGEIRTLKISITDILGMHMQSGWDSKCDQLRTLLAPYELRHKKELTTILELGLWKAKMDQSDGVKPGMLTAVQSVLGIGVKFPDQHREECRLKCGSEVIIRNVVSFL